MSSTPGTSRRCDECRRRRKKCDLAEPACSRCVSRGIRCSGPNNHQIYVHRDAGNIHTQSHRGALRVAMQEHAAHSEPEHTPESLQATAAHPSISQDALGRLIRDTELSLPKTNAPLTSKPAEFFYATILDVFQPRAYTGVFSGDRLLPVLQPAEGVQSGISLCIRGLLPFAKPDRRQLLDMALFSLLTLYMGRLAQDSKLTEMACSAYTTVIRDFRHVIGSSFKTELAAVNTDYCRLYLALFTALQLFEYVNDMGKTGPGFFAHQGGMLELLQISGPEVYQSHDLLQSFAGLRGIATFVALEKRQDTFFSQPEWKSGPFLWRPKTNRERLYDIALRIPGVLAQMDELLASTFKSPSTASMGVATDHDILQSLATAEELFESFKHAKSELEEWLQIFKRTYYPIPMYWETDEIFDSAYSILDTHCIPKHENPKYTLRFRDGQKAGGFICYWGILLELLMGLMEIQNAVSTMIAPTPAAAMRVVSFCQDMDANKSQADATASLMLQSLPYLECCLEGIFVSRLPMGVVDRYFARHRPQPREQRLLD